MLKLRTVLLGLMLVAGCLAGWTGQGSAAPISDTPAGGVAVVDDMRAATFQGEVGTWCPPGGTRCIATHSAIETDSSGRYLRAKITWWCYNGGTNDGFKPCWRVTIPGVALQSNVGRVGPWEGMFACTTLTDHLPPCTANQGVRQTSWHTRAVLTYWSQTGISSDPITFCPDRDFNCWTGVRFSGKVSFNA